ncbi:hypothetical protein [Actinocorallia libanotica]|uniref:Uncharacterized protein n=1 Tax=Actinocorallia libanotica TaxID=46162 RepID=A0ABN1RXL0_9ACTN
MAQRQTLTEKKRNRIIGWWSAIGLLCLVGWQQGNPALWGLAILVWGYYQMFAVPTLCGVETSRGTPCRFRAYGRLMACTREPSHDVDKRNVLLRLIGLGRPQRPITAPAAGRPRRAGSAAAMPAPPFEAASIESKQLFLAIVSIVITAIGTIATIIQTMTA